MRKYSWDLLLAQREHGLKATLAKHANEKHSKSNLAYYAAGYETAWRDLLEILKKGESK